MVSYSIAESEDRLPRLVRQAEQGEDVAITRQGGVVAYLRTVVRPPAPRPSRELAAQMTARERERTQLEESMVDIIRRMRDGEQ